MSRVLFVEPESDTCLLFDDGVYWISVRRQLNAKEEKRLAMGALKRMSPSGAGTESFSVSYDVDFEAAAFNKIITYLLDWNLVDKQGKSVLIDTRKAMESALGALHPDVFKEIERVIDKHVESQQEKKATSGSNGRGTTS